MAERKNQGHNKAQAIIAKYIKESGAEDNVNFTSTVNYATSEEVEKLKKPTVEDYFNEIRGRTTVPVCNIEIEIEPQQKRLNLIFRNSLNIRDMGNPQLGEEDKSNRKNLSMNIIKANKKDNKVCVVYGGDLIGVEWELKYLNNAKILKQETDDGSKESKALFYALGERKRVLKRDIEFSLAQGVEVYLLNGAQEHRVNKYFKIDVLQEIMDSINNPRLHFIRGVNTMVNVVKKCEDGTSRYATIGFQTNNMYSKARQGQSAVSAVKLNSGKNNGDIVFVTNTNVAGKKGDNEYYVSGESKYINAVKGKYPTESPKNYNVFSLNVVDSREITVIQGHNLPILNPLEKIVYDEMRQKEYVENIILENISNEVKRITQTDDATTQDKVKSLQYYKNRYEKRMNSDLSDSKKDTAIETEPKLLEGPKEPDSDDGMGGNGNEL